MGRKSKDPSKSEIWAFFPSSEEREDALEECGEFLGDFDDLFDDDDDDDDDD